MSSPFPSDLARELGDATLELCAIPSVTGDESAICDFVQRALAPLGFHVERVGNSLVARPPGPPRPLVLLVGHLDTVPPNPASGPLRRQDRHVHGLGASDMKSGLAVMLRLARHLSLERTPLAMGLVFYDREEGPYQENGLEPLLQGMSWLRRADLAICLEPTEARLHAGCMGTIHARVTFRGRRAHSARPWQGENAIHKAGELLCRLQGRQPTPVRVAGLTFRETMSATLIHGGKARNVVPDRVELNVNYRFAPGRSLGSAEDRLLAFLGRGVRVEVVDRAPAGPVELAEPLVRHFLELSGAVVAPKEAWTDVARLAAHGIPAVNYGPGFTNQAHQPDEFAHQGLMAETCLALHRFFTTDPPTSTNTKSLVK